jgi:hypothetical protein
MRSVIIPTPGDPLIFLSLLKNLNSRVIDSIDECIILINHIGTVPTSIDDFYKSNNKKIKIIFKHGLCTHGLALQELYSHVKGDVILFLENGNYILDKNIVDFYFKKIESDEYDVIGIERSSCSEFIVSEAQKLYNCEKPSFWSTLFL